MFFSRGAVFIVLLWWGLSSCERRSAGVRAGKRTFRARAEILSTGVPEKSAQDWTERLRVTARKPAILQYLRTKLRTKTVPDFQVVSVNREGVLRLSIRGPTPDEALKRCVVLLEGFLLKTIAAPALTQTVDAKLERVRALEEQMQAMKKSLRLLSDDFDPPRKDQAKRSAAVYKRLHEQLTLARKEARQAMQQRAASFETRLGQSSLRILSHCRLVAE